MINKIDCSVSSAPFKKMSFGANLISAKQNSTENSVRVPEFDASHQRITEEEITAFHEDLAKTGCKDKLSYYFYTTAKDIGSGLCIPAYPPAVAADDRTKNEMAKEIKRLYSDSSTLSEEDKLDLRCIYSTGDFVAPGAPKKGLALDFDI